MAGEQNEPCTHPDFEAHVDVQPVEHEGLLVFMAEIRIACHACGARFYFPGVAGGLAWEHPTVSFDGCELHVPILPVGQPVVPGLPGYRIRGPLSVEATQQGDGGEEGTGDG